MRGRRVRAAWRSRSTSSASPARSTPRTARRPARSTRCGWSAAGCATASRRGPTRGSVDALISRRRALRRGPVVDVRTLVEERYEELSPGLFDAVLAARTELHPIATDVETAEAVDLHPHDRRPAHAAPRPARVRRAAAARRPAGRARRAALHRRGALRRDPLPRGARRRRHARPRPALAARGRDGHRARPRERRADRRRAQAPLARAAHRLPHPRGARGRGRGAARPPPGRPGARAAILSVRPPPGSPVPGRLERDVGLVTEGLEAGRGAAREILG